MFYFNPDGSQSLCGNGSRCAMAFAGSLGIVDQNMTFETTDGIHDGFVDNDQYHFHIHDVEDLQEVENDKFINTGSPHHVRWVSDLSELDVVGEGRAIRYNSRYSPEGTNVNFVTKVNSGIQVRTYERGVENETLSCGTGVTACALVASIEGYESPVKVLTKGGELSVAFKKNGGRFENIYLSGPAIKVFEGTAELPAELK